MAPVSNEQFLFSCIDNSNNGTINFAKVAEECGIVSKGAAYGNIKYRRLKDKFGTASTSASTPTGDEENPGGEGAEETPKKKTPAKKGGTKKRKLSEADDAETTPVKKEEAEDE